MKRLLSLFLIILAANSMTAAAEEYFTLPEIREQSSDGWHKNIYGQIWKNDRC